MGYGPNASTKQLRSFVVSVGRVYVRPSYAGVELATVPEESPESSSDCAFVSTKAETTEEAGGATRPTHGASARRQPTQKASG
jgi:hypothetical protein